MATYDLTTIDAVKEAITLPDNDTDLDTTLPNLISQASLAIMEWTKREFAPVTIEARTFQLDGYHVDFSPGDLQSATQVRLHPETTSPTVLGSGQYMLKPVGAARGMYTSMDLSNYLAITSNTMFQFGYAIIEVTGTWGFPSVPNDVVRACNVTVASWLTRSAPGSSGAYGIPASSAAGATTFRNDWHIPWAACKLLSPYKRGSARVWGL